MTVLQQRIVLASLGLSTLLCLYVPWKWTWHGDRPAGYVFLFLPPTGAGSLDWERLLLEIVVVVSATLFILFLIHWQPWQRRPR